MEVLLGWGFINGLGQTSFGFLVGDDAHQCESAEDSSVNAESGDLDFLLLIAKVDDVRTGKLVTGREHVNAP